MDRSSTELLEWIDKPIEITTCSAPGYVLHKACSKSRAEVIDHVVEMFLGDI